MNDMKIIKSLEESALLIKGVIEEIKNEAKEQKVEFLRMLWRLRCYFIREPINSKDTIRAGKGLIRAGQDV